MEPRIELNVSEGMMRSFRKKGRMSADGGGDGRTNRLRDLWVRTVDALRRPFSLLVLFPTALTAIYFILFATPQYVSEAQFVVRGEGVAPPGALASLLETAGSGSATSEDTYAVQDYMISRDAMEFLIKDHGLVQVYRRPGADMIARFPNILEGRTREHFFKYYQRHVTAELDTTSGISTLSVRTFSAADSCDLARALMVAAEQLVNRMNARQRENLISSSRRELAEATEALKDINLQIASYRTKEALLDPLKQSAPILSNANELSVMLTTSLIQIAQLNSSAPHSPLLPVLRERVRVLRQHIDILNGRVAGPGTTMIPKITAYDELVTQRQLLEKQLEGAALALEAAKTRADRQRLYIDEVVQPNLPDYAAYPKGLASTLIMFISLAALYLMGRLLIAGAREHQAV